MSVILSKSGINLSLKVIENQDKAAEKKKIQQMLHCSKYPIYKAGVFAYWEVPVAALGQILKLWNDILIDGKVQDLVDKFRYNQIPLFDLKREEITVFPLEGTFKHHQEVFVSIDHSKRDVANFLSTGGGKTFCCLMRNANIGCKKTLVVTTISNFPDWERDARKFLGIQPVAYTGTKKQREAIDLNSSQIVLTNYEQIKEIIDRTTPDFFDATVFDEAHTSCGNYNNKTYKLAEALKKKNPNRKSHIVCTATPMESDLSTLWSIINLTDPLVAGKLEDFLGEFQEVTRWKEIRMKNGGKFRQPIEFKTKDLERLRTLLSTIAFRVDLSAEMTFKQDKDVIPLEITEKQRLIYQAAVEEFEELASSGELFDNGANAMVQATKLFRLAEGIFDREDPLSNKFEWLKENLHKEGPKTMVWTISVDASEAYYKEFAYKAVIHNGSKPANYKRLARIAFQGARDSVEEEFFYQYKDKYKLPFDKPGDAELYIGVAAGSTVVGMNLAAAKRQIYPSIPMSARVMDQVMGRNRRLDTEHDIHYTILTSLCTIDSRFVAMVFDKIRRMNEILDGKNSVSEIRVRDILKLIRQKA